MKIFTVKYYPTDLPSGELAKPVILFIIQGIQIFNNFAIFKIVAEMTDFLQFYSACIFLREQN